MLFDMHLAQVKILSFYIGGYHRISRYLCNKLQVSNDFGLCIPGKWKKFDYNRYQKQGQYTIIIIKLTTRHMPGQKTGIKIRPVHTGMEAFYIIGKEDAKMRASNDSKRYLIKTWGCQMNEHDSEKIAGVVMSLGYTPKIAGLNALAYCLTLPLEPLQRSQRVRGQATGDIQGLIGRIPLSYTHPPFFLIIN
jgi:hypothetical protein